MVVLFDNSITAAAPPPSSSTTLPPRPSSSPSSSSRPPPSRDPPAPDRLRLRRAPSRRHPPNQTFLLSKINILDLPTETTATIFRHAHKPKDFHYLLPSGAGPLIPRAYNLPLTVSKEWYRRVMPIYYETLRLSWIRVPDFVENVQKLHESLGRYINSVHVKISGKQFYKAVKGDHLRYRRKDDGGSTVKLSNAQMCLLIGQYIDTPLATFALCLDLLFCLKDLTLRFTDCMGGEVSLQSTSLLLCWVNGSYCIDYCEFTSFSTESISRLRDSRKTISNKSISGPSLSNPAKT